MKRAQLIFVLVCSSACTLVTNPGEFAVGDAGADGQSLDAPSPDVNHDADDLDAEPPPACESASDCLPANGASIDCLGGECVLDCNAGRGDCDRVYANGCEVDTETDLTHCGTCATSCNAAGATDICEAGECRFACIPGRQDCDGIAATGCEASLDGPGSCGGCGTLCVGDTPLCNDDMDGTYSCVMNCGALTECGGSCVDVETQTQNCGECGEVCGDPDQATATCEAGICGYACEEDFRDCNGARSDGCEAYLPSSIANCGACGNVCEGGNAAWSCEAGGCVPSCQAGFYDCNGDVSDGCEATVADADCNPVVDVEITTTRACALREYGEVYCWGLNPRAELGDTSQTARALPHPVLLPDGSPLTGTSLGVGAFHACVVNFAGEVYCWGQGIYGQNGTRVVVTPTHVRGDIAFEAANFIQVVTGSWGTCALSEGGEVWCWGWNRRGQLGQGGVSPDSSDEPLLVPGLSDVASVTSAADAYCALLNDGTVSCWGWNRFGVCGHGAVGETEYRSAADVGLVGITEVACGGSHCAATNAAGAFFYWGRGTGFNHGITDEASVPSPVQHPTIEGVAELSAGVETTCASIDGEPRCWGRRNSGAVGDGTSGGATAMPVAPVGLSAGARIFASSSHACALQSNHLLCWGNNLNGQLGLDESIVRRTPFTLSTFSNTSDISTAGQTAGTFQALHGCAVDDGELYCWGDNSAGQLGFSSAGAYPTPRLVSLPMVTQVHTVEQGTITISAGEAYAFGSNTGGRLGNGGTDTLRTPTLVDLAGSEDEAWLGARHGCARQGGNVYCWGTDTLGQLGRGATVAGDSDLTPGEAVMGVNDAVQLAVGHEFSCVRRGADVVSCWGSNTNSQLGVPTPAVSRVALDIAGITFPMDVSAGYQHACAISRASAAETFGQVVCWGRNAEGQAGAPPSAEIAPTPISGLADAVHVAAYQFHSCAIRENGTVWCWGHNDNHQFGNGTNVDSASPVQVSGVTGAVRLGRGGAGRVNTCATLATGEAACWGGCWAGGCGTSEDILRVTPMPVSGL